ncbi:hypothetical protein BN7_6292 [Wickerhamomyces ciferrii]|uniref:3-beta hydroxysteroid dehydrogenase/isomerase domain-containing protein n=1 Tax=Wickerhamomyces ciferrii (strain ATCC 14091 / BCRC 22168 / CBS 111 / JCM 3599 / NBRC 0793 / NRRL Y-1031 F-60-10) TaxID=1206466 RepID=K0KN54_WICCF|nr:uncharacterized protein BN7_6292 [Wickerhamomyces ciferrii]CCH46695.1 hypothetical protein BN7_6292 [Wickerhamomyces ciferrii]
MSKVFVTGATGFMAQHLINQLLSKDFKVIGSVRSTEKGDKLSSLFQNSNFQYVIVKDLVNSQDDFDQALSAHSDIKYVFHTASPVFPKNLKDVEKDMIEPAIHGTQNILRSVHKNLPNVEKFIYTSSLAAIRSEDGYSQDEVVTEESWNNVKLNEAKNDSGKAYEASKTHGEKAVWDFFQKNHDVNFKFSIINPVYIFGPQLFDEYVSEQLNFSCEIINKILKKQDDEILGYSIDVRDVAKAHVSCIENSKTDSQRLLTALAPYNNQTLKDLIHKHFPQVSNKVDIGKPGSDQEVFKGYYTLDNSKTKEILGFEFIPQEQTIVDTVSQILKVQGKI